MGCTRHGSCYHSRASGRWMRHSSCAVACATIAALTATAAAVGAAVRPAPRQLLSQSRLQLLHAPRQLLPRSQLQLLHAQRQVVSQPWQRPGSCRQSQRHSHRPMHPVRFPSERGAVARGEQCVRGCFGTLPALCCLARRALDAASAASNEVAGGVGASTRRTRRTAQEGRARRAPAQGISSGHAAAGSGAQDEPEAQRRRGGMQRRRRRPSRKIDLVNPKLRGG